VNKAQAVFHIIKENSLKNEFISNEENKKGFLDFKIIVFKKNSKKNLKICKLRV